MYMVIAERVRAMSKETISGVQGSLIGAIQRILHDNNVHEQNVTNDAIPLNGHASIRGNLPDGVDVYTIVDIEKQVRESVEDPESIDWSKMTKRD